MSSEPNDALLLLIRTIADQQRQLDENQRTSEGKILGAVEGVHIRLDTLNGRTRKNEIAIADIQARREERDKAYVDVKQTADAAMAAYESVKQTLAAASSTKSDNSGRSSQKDKDDKDDSMIRLSMSKTMFTSLVSGIAAVWVFLGPYISKLLGLSQ